MPPFFPPGTSRGLIDRLRRRQLGPETPIDTGDASAPEQEEAISQGLWSRIVDRFNRVFAPKVRPLREPPLGAVRPDRATSDLILRDAGRRLTLVLLKYNGQQRHVESYSYRPAPEKRREDGVDFFGYCRIHDEIHRFILRRIETLMPTDEVFTPRWTVELT